MILCCNSKCVVKYRNHPSILAIGEVCNKHPRLSFSFSKINRQEILRQILKLLKHAKILIFRQKLSKRIRICLLTFFLQVLMILSENLIPYSPKKENITTVFKKGDRNPKDNYRPVSIVPNMSKIFERCIFRQL